MILSRLWTPAQQGVDAGSQAAEFVCGPVRLVQLNRSAASSGSYIALLSVVLRWLTARRCFKGQSAT